MMLARSTASSIAVIDVPVARIEDSSVAPGAAAARLPDGYDRTDVRVLEWIVSSGRHPLRKRTSELAA
jgi:hypothetical protein